MAIDSKARFWTINLLCQEFCWSAEQLNDLSEFPTLASSSTVLAGFSCDCQEFAHELLARLVEVEKVWSQFLRQNLQAKSFVYNVGSNKALSTNGFKTNFQNKKNGNRFDFQNGKKAIPKNE